MKTERLYAITVYLLNHGRTSASELAEYFEVSTRTIQRDMDSLCLAGIPVVAVNGAAGGYEISDRFTMEKGFATADDYARIRTALRGLVSATDDQGARHTLEKITHASDSGDSGIILDFSVLREGISLPCKNCRRRCWKSIRWNSPIRIITGKPAYTGWSRWR